MNRIEKTFSQLKENQKKALIPFITTGDPVGIETAELMHALVQGGADMIELGVPFSDPAADGPVIQQASERALQKNTSFTDVLRAVTDFRKEDQQTPIIAMGYLNPAEFYHNGFADYVADATQAGIDAVILVDLSFESGQDYRKVLNDKGLDLIQLVAPTTSAKRLESLTQEAKGFIYYVSMRGTTGSGQTLDQKEIGQAIDQIRSKTDLPICVGFGISDGESAKNMAKYADGIVVGSALVKKLYNVSLEQQDIGAAATDFIQMLRDALDS